MLALSCIPVLCQNRLTRFLLPAQFAIDDDIVPLAVAPLSFAQNAFAGKAGFFEATLGSQVFNFLKFPSHVRYYIITSNKQQIIMERYRPYGNASQ
jgi:hypothetical protein